MERADRGGPGCGRRVGGDRGDPRGAGLRPHEGLEEFVGDPARLAPQIPGYAARRAAGQRTGSGGAEKGCDVLVNRRCQGKRGMRWSDAGLEAAIALRLDLLNGDWNARSPARHQP